MKKLNVSIINNNQKEDAVLKIKDDSLTITTADNSIVKVPYSDIKDYEYSKDEQLTLKRKHSSDIVLEVSFDTTLISKLKEIKNVPINEVKEVVKVEEKIIENKDENIETSQDNNVNNTEENNSDNSPIAQIISGIVILVVIVFVLSKFGVLNYFLNMFGFNTVSGTYVNHDSGAKIVISGDSAKMEFEDDITQFTSYEKYKDGSTDYIAFYYSDGSKMICTDYTWATDPHIRCNRLNFNKE